MTDSLLSLSSSEIDELPFGYIAMKKDGTIVKYNRYEADLARLNQKEVLGKNFFRDVAPCTQVQKFEGRFRRFVDDETSPPALSFDFVFAFRHGLQNVHIGFVKSPAKDEIIVTVNRFQKEELALDVASAFDGDTGQLRSPLGHRVVVVDDAFWRSLDSVLQDVSEIVEGLATLRVGIQWGTQQALRADRFFQQERALNIREIQLREVLDLLSKSIRVLSLGTFEADIAFRSEGVILVRHFHSPFVEFFSEREEGSCSMLAGLHAGIFSYLSGRELSGRELSCSKRPEEACRFVVGTASRINSLFSAESGSADAQLLTRLQAATPVHAGI